MCVETTNPNEMTTHESQINPPPPPTPQKLTYAMNYQFLIYRDPRELIVVGTCMAVEDEEEPKEGRLLVFHVRYIAYII